MVCRFTLLNSLAGHGRLRPDSIALVSGSVQVSYGELNAMAATAWAQISKLDLPSGAPVAVHAAKSPRTIALIIACLLAGRPFLLLSAQHGPVLLGKLLQQANCAAVLTAGEPPHLTDHAAHQINCDIGQSATGWSAQPDKTEHTDSFMFTTSGSTGIPKVVPLTFAAVNRFTDWASTQFSISHDTVVLSYSPLTFDLCLLEIWATLKAGGTAVLVDTQRANNSKYLAELLTSRQVNVVQGVTILYRLLASAHPDQSFPSVRHAIVTGETIRTSLLGQLPRMFPNARIYNVYGSTETNDSFMHEAAEEFDSGTEMPIGRPLPGVDALIVDDDGAVIHGPATGELLVATPFQSQGYLFQADTNEKFVRLENRQHTYFRSGDLVRRDRDGVVTFLGRNDRQVKVRGVRVNLDEIERVLDDHPLVAQVVAVALPDDLAGLRINAIVHGTKPDAVNILALRDYCASHLARTAIPSKIRIADRPLPTTTTGKPDRQAVLREELMDHG